MGNESAVETAAAVRASSIRELSAQGSPDTAVRVAAFDHQEHLRAELLRIAIALGGFLTVQRNRGRSPAGDLVQGLVIEDGEAGGLVAQLVESWGRRPDEAPRVPQSARTVLAAQADASVLQGLPMPLRLTELAFQLAPHEYDALLLALSVDLDPRFGRLIAYLNDHIERTRPTLGLALALAAVQGNLELLQPFAFLERPIIRDGLLDVTGDGPKPGCSLMIAPDLAAYLVDAHPRKPERSGVSVHARRREVLLSLVLNTECWLGRKPQVNPIARPCYS